jgi:hypothetical protein
MGKTERDKSQIIEVPRIETPKVEKIEGPKKDVPKKEKMEPTNNIKC